MPHLDHPTKAHDKAATKPIAPTRPQGEHQTTFTAEGAPPPGAVGAAHVAYTPLSLNIAALQAIVQEPRSGLAAAQQTPWVTDVIALLNGALATEWVCVLRYRRHHFTAKGLASVKIAEEFLTHSNEELGHADRLARRIVQLEGLPDFSPATLLARSHVPYDDPLDLESMIKCNWLAERVAIESYGQMISLVGTQDPTTRRLLEDILAQEQEHAEELSDWLTT